MVRFVVRMNERHFVLQSHDACDELKARWKRIHVYDVLIVVFACPDRNSLREVYFLIVDIPSDMIQLKDRADRPLCDQTIFCRIHIVFNAFFNIAQLDDRVLRGNGQTAQPEGGTDV